MPGITVGHCGPSSSLRFFEAGNPVNGGPHLTTAHEQRHSSSPHTPAARLSARRRGYP
ncbi:hypothetical protein [Okibacterium sp. HSC-33S16]|uniref:hypothetical protein n=1 Tax=Okibacterium sp. HSC-33S16 TaxID=2910965 RepID=UPI00209D314C|nr:hypothetical protein [Okibacterium sp. HSC-33S16]